MTQSSQPRTPGASLRCPFLGTDGVGSDAVCRAVLDEVVSPFPPYLKSYCLVARHVACANYLKVDESAVEALSPESRQVLENERAGKEQESISLHLREFEPEGDRAPEARRPPLEGVSALTDPSSSENLSALDSVQMLDELHRRRDASVHAADLTDSLTARHEFGPGHSETQRGVGQADTATNAEADSPHPVPSTPNAPTAPSTESAAVPRGDDLATHSPSEDVREPLSARPFEAIAIPHIPATVAADATSDTGRLRISPLIEEPALNAGPDLRKLSGGTPDRRVSPRLSVPVIRRSTAKSSTSPRAAASESLPDLDRFRQSVRPADSVQGIVPPIPGSGIFEELDIQRVQVPQEERSPSPVSLHRTGRLLILGMLCAGLAMLGIVISSPLMQHFGLVQTSSHVAVHAVPAPARTWSFGPIPNGVDQVLVSLVNRGRNRVIVQIQRPGDSGRRRQHISLPPESGIEMAIDPHTITHGLEVTAGAPFIASRTMVTGTRAQYGYGSPAHDASKP